MSSEYRLFWIVAGLSTVSCLLPIVIGLKGFKKRELVLKVICVICFVSVCVDLISLKSPKYANQVNNFFLLFEFISLLIIYYNFPQQNKNRLVYISLGIVYFIFFIAELMFYSLKQFNSYSITLTSIVFIYFSVRYFYFLMRDLPTDQIQRLPMFWVNTGVLTYFAGGLFLFAMRNYVIAAFHDDQTIYWSFHNFLNIIKNSLFAFGMWQEIRNRKVF